MSVVLIDDLRADITSIRNYAKSRASDFTNPLVKVDLLKIATRASAALERQPPFFQTDLTAIRNLAKTKALYYTNALVVKNFKVIMNRAQVGLDRIREVASEGDQFAIGGIGTKSRYTLLPGFEGPDVYALKAALNAIAPAGANIPQNNFYGPYTVARVRDIQAANGLMVTGNAGVSTQKVLAKCFIAPAQLKYSLPVGMLDGLTEGESGWYVGAISWNRDFGALGYSSCDIGWLQDNISSVRFTDSTAWKHGYDPVAMYNETALMLRNMKDKFFPMPGCQNDRRAWELALLHHNWPTGAYKLARGEALSTLPAEWVINIGVMGVSSPADWADFYIETKTHLIEEWTR